MNANAVAVVDADRLGSPTSVACVTGDSAGAGQGGPARCSGRMNHLSRVRESHSITAAVRNDDRARRVVGCVSRPIALKLQQHLYPTAQASAGLLQPAKRQLVTRQREPATRIRRNEHVESLVKGRQRWK